MMKRLIYQVTLGPKSNLYDHCNESVAKYCEKYDIDHIIQRDIILGIKPNPFSSNRSTEAVAKFNALPIYEKENAFGYFPEYDQIAIIDSDVFIRDTAPNIFDDLEPEYNFGGVVEREMPIHAQYAAKITNYSRMQYSGLKHVDWKWNDHGAEFMNMGVMVMNKSFARYLFGQTPKEFLARTEFQDFIDGKGPWKWSTDQTLLNTWIKEEKMWVKNMDWRWNALYSALRPDQIQKAHFVHFFLKDKLPARGENVPELMRKIGE